MSISYYRDVLKYCVEITSALYSVCIMDLLLRVRKKSIFNLPISCVVIYGLFLKVKPKARPNPRGRDFFKKSYARKGIASKFSCSCPMPAKGWTRESCAIEHLVQV